jgi:putative transposase
MPEHAHVLLLPKDSAYSIAEILKTIKQPVGQRSIHFLRRKAPEWLGRLRVVWPSNRVEHRFWQQGGGYDRNMHTARSAWASVQYIHNNPVRRGLVRCPVDWFWSSAGWYGGQPDVPLAMDTPPPDILPRA